MIKLMIGYLFVITCTIYAGVTGTAVEAISAFLLTCIPFALGLLGGIELE